MGQQQLLLLVLGIVIVGIAVVAGITAFSEGKDKADRDAATADAMRIVSDVQAWKLKPNAFGGGATSTGFTGVTFQSIGIVPNNGTKYESSSGCYQLAGGTNATVTVFKKDCTTTISTVTIAGTTTANVTWAYST
jgi:type II secretory pathway pseudopilin PulG